jgi:S-DNA-T family DNA segregation ATPase FtsK/SpoIIIE
MAPKKPIKSAPKEQTQNLFESSPFSKADKKSPSTSASSIWEKFKAIILDEKTCFVIGVFTLFSVFFLFISFLSYFFTGSYDQSKMELPWREILSQRSEIHNWASVMGAILSELFINRWYGIASVSFLYFGLIIGLRLINVKVISVWKAGLHGVFWLIWISILCGFVFDPLLNDFLFFSLGGQHGDAISNQLVSFIGYPGVALLLLVCIVCYFALLNKSLILFIRGLFSKKSPQAISSDSIQETEREDKSVAIGTEIIPETWVVTNQVDEPSDFIEDNTSNNTDTNELDEVHFEIESSEVEPDFEIVSVDNEEEVEELELEIMNFEEDESPSTISKLEKYDPTLDLSNYNPPTLDLLKVYSNENETQIDMDEQKANKNRIITTLQNYGIEIDSIKATVGPTITLYEIVPKAGVRISKIRNLESDIMLSLAATGIRIIAPIPGKGTIGIEVPNSVSQVVSMHSTVASKKFQESTFDLPVVFGRTITNEIFMVDLAKMPHLLVAGATGQGKSVGLNAIITSLLYKKHPSQLKLVLVDPKKVEFNIYADIEKHFLAKLPDGEDAIITDTSKVVETLNSLCKEMDDRYDLLKKAHVRNLKEYNEKFTNRNLNPENGHRYLPYIVVIVDEFGDLIMTAGKEVEMPIARIAQLARAVGIHMIIATQRPSVNIITGVIKANFPARVAFRVSSMIDSRTILDAPGANQLVGRGDMLFSQGSDLTRVQCAFIDTPEVENIVNHIKTQQAYPTAFYLPEYLRPDGEGLDASSVDLSKRDPLFEEAARLIVASQQGSTSLIQRKFSIGYNRAGRIVDQLEVAGIIGPFEGSKARQVLVMDEYHLEQILKNIS